MALPEIIRRLLALEGHAKDKASNPHGVTVAQILKAMPSLLVNLASTTAANPLDEAPRPGVTGILPVARGGTGVNTLAALKTALGISAASGGLRGVLLSASTTWTVPAGVGAIIAFVLGGGGGGGAGGYRTGSPLGTTFHGGGGGGSGGMMCAAIPVSPGQAVPVVVGAGGAGALSLQGGNPGGVSSVFGTIRATGGQGGHSGSVDSAGGAGGSLHGYPGAPGSGGASGQGVGGAGGSGIIWDSRGGAGGNASNGSYGNGAAGGTGRVYIAY
jgi:hypothetical protein